MTVELGEARHVLRSSPREFDLVVMHAIDTWTASAQGAYSLSENFLYTSEAMRDWLAKLQPGGVVSIRRWLFWPPRETLRLFTTVLDALAARGRRASRVAGRRAVAARRLPRPLAAGLGLPVVLESRRSTATGWRELDRYVHDQGWTYLYRPGSVLDTPFSEYARASDRAGVPRGVPVHRDTGQ